jgi:hypothetical protein
MSAPEVETTLARLYTDEGFRRAFLDDPLTGLNGLDLSREEKAALAAMDRAGLVMAAASYRHKQALRASKRSGLVRRAAHFIRGWIRWSNPR